MFEKTLKVKYITLKNCFCYLSDKHSKVIEQGSVGKVNFEDETYYFSLGDHLINLKENEIGLNSIYAELLGLNENATITFTQCNNLPGITNLDISPCTKDDFEILEIMAENIQNTLLNQIRIVNNNQKAIIWISNSIYIIVEIDGAKPVSPGRLEYLTEVALKMKISKKIDKKPGKLAEKWNINNIFNKLTTIPVSNDTILKKYNGLTSPLIFRVYSSDCLKCINKNLLFSVYTPKNSLPLNVFENKNDYFALQPIHLPSESGFLDENISNQRSIIVRLCYTQEDDFILENRNFTPLFLNNSILNHYSLKSGAKIILLPANFDIPSVVNKIEIFTDNYNLKQVEKQFKRFVGNNCMENGILLNSDVVIDMENNKMKFKFTSDSGAGLVDSNFVRNGKISVSNSMDLKINDVKIAPRKTEEICLNCSNFKEIFDGSLDCLKLGLSVRKMEHVLVTGKSGTGKSSITNYFSEKISLEPYHIYAEIVNCKQIKGKSIDSLHKFFINIFQKLIYYQPSLLIIDDLDVICEKVSDGDALTQEALQFNKISEMLLDLFEHYLDNNAIMLITTAESTLKLNQNLFSSRGKHILKNIYNVKELDKSGRKFFLNFTLSKHDIDKDLDFDELSRKTEGFVVQDLMDFVEKCVFESYKEDSEFINFDHCLNALNASSTLSLTNVKFHSTGDRDFSDIGGMEHVKEVLIESMMWPAQYTNIFGNSPLRLQSGLLLYGPPGTGKTILAEAAAKQCGLRLISVKGPELLSKYIGASEQAVRDVFQKAQSAKPCILFFDEFDSLAPRRGHDNTGVTDRVVNQFLTQLDGVENLTGVCVLAATSRPDLLDPALLRPGRLDRQILCPLPTEDERLSILKALSKSLRFPDDVNLEKIASLTDGFSGADLQGVLYTAQLTEVEQLINETDVEDNTFDGGVINQDTLEEALRNSRPSLTKEEKLKYERIYAKFQGKLDIKDMKGIQQKATLA